MAQVFDEPEGMEFKYDYSNYGMKAYDKAVKDHIAKLKTWCEEHNASNGKLVGETISFQVADGYAQYMIFSTKPLRVIHMSMADGYNADPILIRGLRVSDVKDLIKRDQAMKKLFS